MDTAHTAQHALSSWLGRDARIDEALRFRGYHRRDPEMMTLGDIAAFEMTVEASDLLASHHATTAGMTEADPDQPAPWLTLVGVDAPEQPPPRPDPPGTLTDAPQAPPAPTGVAA